MYLFLDSSAEHHSSSGIQPLRTQQKGRASYMQLLRIHLAVNYRNTSFSTQKSVMPNMKNWEVNSFSARSPERQICCFSSPPSVFEVGHGSESPREERGDAFLSGQQASFLRAFSVAVHWSRRCHMTAIRFRGNLGNTSSCLGISPPRKKSGL